MLQTSTKTESVRRWARRVKGVKTAKGEAVQIDELIKENRRITITEINGAIEMSRCSAGTLVNKLGNSKFCVLLAPPWQLTDTLKQQRVKTSTELQTGDNTFL